MKSVKIKFLEHDKHRMPQYTTYGIQEILPQEKEKYIWLRLQVEVCSNEFELSFFVQSKIEIAKIHGFGELSNSAYQLTFHSFPNYLSRMNDWNIFGLQDFEPVWWLGKSLDLRDLCLADTVETEAEIEITDELYVKYLHHYDEIEKIVTIYRYCRKELKQLVSSSQSSGFGYISGEIRLYLSFLNACASSVTRHSHKGWYFKDNVKKIERAFEELIKRKQVNNFNYQYALDNAREGLFSLDDPRVWDSRYPNIINWNNIKIS
jgi:hypothetical protein